MALPPAFTSWPPKQLDAILPRLAIWDAWYTGDTDRLSAVYGGPGANDPSAAGFFATDQGGFKGVVGRALQRWFWGEVTRGPDRRNKLHIPIASDICQASADLLFADGFTLKASNAQTQTQLDEMLDDGMQTKLAEASEIAAALGGVYLRVTWDESIADAPFTTTMDADQAIPEFAWDQLRAVTFWQVLRRDGKTVYRHLERHELDSAGVGVILHGLYKGAEDDLGMPVPLTELTATAGLAELVDENSSISTESPGLAVTYLANQRPQRRWRKDPVGRSLGRSDLDGIEGLMDSLDEAWSSWMRDLRLGKARLMVAKSLLEDNGPGKGASFDADQELYSAVNSLTKGGDKLSEQMDHVQFDIRVAEHQSTTQSLVEQILRTAGYSSQTFGEGEAQGTRTATEIENKQQRSLLTRDRKLRLARPALADHVHKLLLVDAAIFGNKTAPTERPEVQFADGVQESQLNLAQTAQALRAAEAASTETLVGLIHPDWDDAAVAVEVAKINAEKPTMPDPTGFGDPTDLNEPSDPTGGQ